MTRIYTYGLIGKKLAHSFSPKYFNHKFEREGISSCRYQLFPLAQIKDFLDLVKTYDLDGLNVTIPFKQAIIPFLDDISDDAEAVGAVNCIAIKENKLIGHNTDVIGFERSLTPLIPANKIEAALILGTGGAAKAVTFVLNKLNIPYKLVSRNPGVDMLSYSEAEKQLRDFSLVINTTPVGTNPNIYDCPLNSFEGIGENHLVYDLTYNPPITRLLEQSSALGARIKNGEEMLTIQAEESWEIWQST